MAVFRGGTSLKKMYFPDYRFSEDLDFIINKDKDLKLIDSIVEEVLKIVSKDFSFTASKTSDIGDGRLQTFIKYDIAPEIRSKKELKVDILADDKIPSYTEREVIFTYRDFADTGISLITYDLESIAADKISRIMDVDKEARDIFDLWYLLKLDYIKIPELINQLKKRHGFIPHFQNLVKDIESDIYRKTWEIRLKQQVLDLPSYESVIKDLKILIKTKLISGYD